MTRHPVAGPAYRGVIPMPLSMSQSHSLLAPLALGLITLVGIQPGMADADNDPPIRAWVEFDEQGETVMLSGDSEIVECVACGRTGIKARIQPTACPHDCLDDVEGEN